MHPMMVKAIVECCHQRQSEGDYPTVPSFSVEQLEDCIVQLTVGAAARAPEPRPIVVGSKWRLGEHVIEVTISGDKYVGYSLSPGQSVSAAGLFTTPDFVQRAAWLLDPPASPAPEPKADRSHGICIPLVADTYVAANPETGERARIVMTLPAPALETKLAPAVVEGAEIVELPRKVEPELCLCERCCSERRPFSLSMRMVVCQTCGNKRCPKATWHGYRCSGSNEPNQVGELEANGESK